jgi:hypothetical protein
MRKALAHMNSSKRSMADAGTRSHPGPRITYLCIYILLVDSRRSNGSVSLANITPFDSS